MLARTEQVINNVFSFEILFALFVYASVYKGDPRLESFPIDLTAGFATLSISVGFIILMKRGFSVYKQSITACSIFFSLCVWMMISLMYSPSVIYGPDKVMKFALLTGWAFTGSALIIAEEMVRVRRFLLFLVITGLIMAVDVINSYLSGAFIQTGFGSAFGSTYLQTAQTAGEAMIVVAMGFLFSKRNAEKFRELLLIGLFVFVAGLTGGRGPVINLALAFFVLILSLLRYQASWNRLYFASYSKNVIVFVTLTTILVVGFYYYGYFGTAFERLTILFYDSDMGDSASTRLGYYNQAIRIWFNNPFIGVGIGGFPVAAGFGDAREYPHNLILEMISELGLVGLFLVGLFLCYVIGLGRGIAFSSYFESKERLIALLLVIYSLLNAMVSGDFNDNRIFFAYSGLLFLNRPTKDDT